MLTAEIFATSLCARLEGLRDKTSVPWTSRMADVLSAIGSQHELVTYGHGAGGGAKHREYLWDYTMYADRRDGALPVVVIEHENQHHFDAFRDDFWKTLMANAPLRVAIGYCARVDDRAGWVARINQEAATGVWDSSFLGPSQDLIALGFDDMLENDGNFLCWVRSDGSRRWSPYAPGDA